jgi:tetratricopeptide (TPR) repeat protein
MCWGNTGGRFPAHPKIYMNKPVFQILILMLAALLAAGGAGCTSKAKKAYHLHRADKFYAAGQFDSAEIEYINVLRNDPDSQPAYARLGDIYYQQGRLQTAAPYLYKASAMDTNDLDLRLKLGYVYASFGQYKEAREDAAFILARNPKDDEAPLLLAASSATPKDLAATRALLGSLARNGDRAAYEVALGTLSLHDQDLKSAAAAFHRAVALDPKSPSALEAMGAYCAAQNDLPGAEANFKAASDLSDARSARRMMYARFKLEMGRPDDAKQILTDAVKQAPDYVPALLGLAEIALTQTNYDEARNYSSQVLARDPDNFDALMFQSQLSMAQNEVDQAVAALERMSKLYPQASGVQYQLATASLAAGDDARAALCLNHALELDPNFTQAKLLLARVQIQDRNPDPAIVSMSDLAQKQPQLEDAQLLLADAYRERDRINDALAVYQSLENTFPKDTKLPLLMGSAYLQLKDSAHARAAFEQAQQMAPGNTDALSQLVNLDLAENNYTAAMQRVQNELQNNPKDITLHLLVAQVLMAQKKTDEAEASLIKTDALDPGNQDVNLLLSQLYLNTRQNDKALAKLQEVTSKNPKNMAAWMLAAAIYEQEKDYKSEADAYEKALVASPKMFTVLNNLAYVYSEDLNQLDRAYDLANQARTLQPFDPSTADTLGWIDLKRGSYTAAVGLLQEAAQKLPGIPEVQFHAGMANYMTDDDADARAAFQQALQPGTPFRGQEECQLCLSLLDIDPRTADTAAIAKLEKRVADKPNDPVALGRLAAIYEHNGNRDKAVPDYEAVLHTDPNNLTAMIALARLYVPSNLARAMEMAKAANKAAPDNVEAMHLMGQIAYQTGDFKLAASWLQQSSKNQPDDAQEQFDYARAAYNIGDVPTAQAALQSALNLNLPAPQSAEAQRMLDMINLAANPSPPPAASQQVADLLKANPGYVPAIMADAVIHWQNSGTAAADGEKVLAQLPDFAPAQRLLAIIYARDPGKTARAYEMAMKARNSYPDDSALAKATAIIVLQQGDYSRAERLLLTCTAGPDADAETYYYLGSAQFQLKEHIASKSSLQQALALKLSGPLADNAKKMLAQLK